MIAIIIAAALCEIMTVFPCAVDAPGVGLRLFCGQHGRFGKSAQFPGEQGRCGGASGAAILLVGIGVSTSNHHTGLWSRPEGAFRAKLHLRTLARKSKTSLSISPNLPEMGWMPLSPDGIAMCQTCGVEAQLTERTFMEEVSIIGVDLAMNVFQLHGAAAAGSVVFRKKLSRLQFGRFMADHPACEVAMEACPSAQHWARELTGQGCPSSNDLEHVA